MNGICIIVLENFICHNEMKIMHSYGGSLGFIYIFGKMLLWFSGLLFRYKFRQQPYRISVFRYNKLLRAIRNHRYKQQQ